MGLNKTPAPSKSSNNQNNRQYTTAPNKTIRRDDFQGKKKRKKKGRTFVDDFGYLQTEEQEQIEGVYEGDDGNDEDIEEEHFEESHNPFAKDTDNWNEETDRVEDFHKNAPMSSDKIPYEEWKRRRELAKIKFKPAQEWIQKTSEKVLSRIKDSQPLQFYQLQSDYYTRDGKPILRFYGCDADGNTVCTHIHDFEPYFYADAERWNGDIPKFKEFLKNRASNLRPKLTQDGRTYQPKKDVENWITNITIREAIPIKKYQTKKRKLFKITTTLPNYVSQLRSLLEDQDTKKHCPPKWDPIKTYESNIPFVLRYMTDCQIKGSTWVELTNYKVREGDSKMTTCNLELDISYKNMVQLQQTGAYTMPPPFRIVSYDIECKGQKNHFPQAKNDPVITIACVMVNCGEEVDDRKKCAVKKDALKVVFQLNGCAPIDGAIVYSFKDEKTLLNAWRDFMIATNAELWVGHNHTQFDMPYLMHRAEALGIGERFSMLGRVIGEKSTIREHSSGSKQRGNRKIERVDVGGRTYFDTCLVFKTDFKLPSYTLNAVSAEFLGDRKDDVHHSRIAELFGKDDVTRNRLARYCLKDTLLPIQLIAKRNLLFSALLLSRVTGVPLSYIYERGQTIRIVMQILAKIRTMDYVIPVELQKEIEKIIGAHVFDPIAGYYGPKKPIATLDWASLYPSIMIAHNLCFTTYIDEADIDEYKLDRDKDITTTFIDCSLLEDEDDGEGDNPKDDDEQKKKKKKPDDKENVKKDTKKDKKQRPPKIEQGKKVEQKTTMLNFFKNHSGVKRTNDEISTTSDNPIVDVTTSSSNKKQKNGYNTHFVKPHIRLGILPQILRELLAERKEAKKKAARHAEDGEEPDPILYLIYNLLQNVLKICANSIYGFTGAFAGPLPFPKIASTVTARGRDMIQKCADFVRKHYTGSQVVYGDTDSIMVWFCVDGKMVDNVKDAMILGKKVAADITKWFREMDVIKDDPRELTFEKIFSPYLLHKKKKYAGQKWMEPKNWDQKSDPTPEEKLHIAGLECGRRDFPELTRESMSKSLAYILKHNDVAAAENHIKNQVRALYLNRMDMGKLVVTRNFSKNLEDYKGAQPHTTLIKKLKERDPTYEPVLGDRIPYIMIETDKVKNITFKNGVKVMKDVGTCERAEDPIYAINNRLPIDVNYYIEGLLKRPLKKVFMPIYGSEEEMNKRLYHGEHTRRRIRPMPKEFGRNTLGREGLGSIVLRHCLECNSLIHPPSDEMIEVTETFEDPETGEVYEETTLKSANYEVFHIGKGAICDHCLSTIEGHEVKVSDQLKEDTKECQKLWDTCFKCAEIKTMKEDNCAATSCPQFYWRTQMLGFVEEGKDAQSRIKESLHRRETLDVKDLEW